jgi:hypothetical protein
MEPQLALVGLETHQTLHHLKAATVEPHQQTAPQISAVAVAVALLLLVELELELLEEMVVLARLRQFLDHLSLMLVVVVVAFSLRELRVLAAQVVAALLALAQQPRLIMEQRELLIQAVVVALEMK